MADACIKCVEELALTTPSKNLISKWLPTFLQDHESAENISVAEFLSWAQTHPQLRVMTSAVPPSVGVSGQIHDIKISGYGPDDSTYDNNAEMRNKVARGNCVLTLDNQDPKLFIYGLKKFTGGLGDDDDKNCGDNHTWHRYFTKPLDEVSKVICTQKANGEAAHLSACIVNGEQLICAGSKNVHLLFKNRDDISNYEGDRYLIAKVVCYAVVDLLDKMNKQQKDGLVNFLHLSHFTAIFELLNPEHQHVEDLSHLERAELQFITWSKNVVIATEETSDLCCVPPHVGIELARLFGIPTITYNILTLTELTNHMVQIRRGYGYEGEVLYFVDAADTVVGLLKKKTIWYILCRAIREKTRNAICRRAKSPVTFSMDKTERKIEHRLTEVQEWLGIDVQTIGKWKVMGVDFFRWCARKCDAGEIGTKHVADQFPIIWKKFLSEEDYVDTLDVSWTEDDQL